MKVEPAVDHPSLIARVCSLYSIPTVSLVFIPVGECGVSYRVDCADGRRFYLKLWSDQRQAMMLRQQMDVVLPLIRELFETGLVTNLAYPIPTQTGKLSEMFGRYALALYAYIEGQPVDGADENSSNLLEQIAVTMARLHRAAPLLRSPLPQRSAFDTSFSADMRRGLEDLRASRPDLRGGQARLRELLLPRREELLRRLIEVEDLARIAEDRAGELVLCHTDMGGNNRIVGTGGRVYILDWDDLIMAPAEHDLHEYRGPGFPGFLRKYVQAGGVQRLDLLQFRFYLLRRYLADLTDWLIRIDNENIDAEQDTNDLRGIEDYCLYSIDRFEKEMQEIEASLQGYG